MAKGVDELVNHVLSEIALTGVQGTYDSRLPLPFAFCLCPSQIEVVCLLFAQHSLCNHLCVPQGRCSRVTPGPATASSGVRNQTVHHFLYRAYGHPTDRPQELAVPTSSVSSSPSMKSSKMKMELTRALDLSSWALHCMRGSGNG